MKRDQPAKLYPKYGHFLLSKVLGRYPRPRPKMSGMYSCYYSRNAFICRQSSGIRMQESGGGMYTCVDMI